MDIPVTYETLRVVWWGLMGILLIGFAITDGFDLGVAALLPFIAKTDDERRMVINTVGPTWEGNQVWLILGGGAIFAAWPLVYAVSFSGFYLAMFVVLAALILRPVGFKYRSKRDSKQWREAWDWALFIGGAVPALIFGVAVGNVLQGVPFTLSPDELRVTYTGWFIALLNPFALLCGLASVAMLVLHGAAWLSMKAEKGPVRDRALAVAPIAGIAAIVLFALGGVWIMVSNMGYSFVDASAVDPAGPSNPLLNEVAKGEGGWLANYSTYPWMIAAPVLGLLGAGVAVFGVRLRNEAMTFLGSSASAAGIIASVGASMFPFILPSSSDPTSSLSVWDASSSHLTLFLMLIVTIVFLPIVLAYTAWAFKILWGRVTTQEIAESSSSFY